MQNTDPINSPLDWVLVAIIVIMALYVVRNFLLRLAAAAGGQTVRGGQAAWFWGILALVILWLVNR